MTCACWESELAHDISCALKLLVLLSMGPDQTPFDGHPVIETFTTPPSLYFQSGIFGRRTILGCGREALVGLEERVVGKPATAYLEQRKASAGGQSREDTG